MIAAVTPAQINHFKEYFSHILNVYSRVQCSNMVVSRWWVISRSPWWIRKIQKDNKTTGSGLWNTHSILYYVATTFKWAWNKPRANGWFILAHNCIYTQNTQPLRPKRYGTLLCTISKSHASPAINVAKWFTQAEPLTIAYESWLPLRWLSWRWSRRGVQVEHFIVLSAFVHSVSCVYLCVCVFRTDTLWLT